MRSIALVLAVAIATSSCARRVQRKVGATLATVDGEAAFLKIHLPDGSVYVLHDWYINEHTKKIIGTGELWRADRSPVASGSFAVSMDSVALYETNTIYTSPGVAALAVVTGISLAITGFCISSPKSCFGSCPTFYARSDDGRLVLQAEGFSDSIAPALERNDIDALWQTTGRGGTTTIVMTNEAYETHVVKQVDVLAVPRPAKGRVLATADRLWRASALAAPVACTAAEGSCLPTLAATDGNERRSTTDPEDLAAHETIDLGFVPASGRLGVVISARQSLVTTFLLYQGLAYLGRKATAWLAKLDADARAGGEALKRLVGGIEVQIEVDGAWRTVGEVYETGPIATDVHLIVLPERARAERMRLVLQRGGWRIDGIALATLAGEVEPLRIAPSRIRGTLGAEYGRGRAPATTFPIVALPGDRYELEYRLPPGDDYELFLDSRGYYLEWMRKEWLGDENLLAATRLIADPAAMLRELAPAYKRVEPEIEQIFWRSRYAHP